MRTVQSNFRNLLIESVRSLLIESVINVPIESVRKKVIDMAILT